MSKSLFLTVIIGEGNAIASGTKLILLRVSPLAIILTEDGIETSNVDAGSSISFSYNGITLPSNLSPGKYQISVEVDSLTTTGEINFANNVKKSAEFTVVAKYSVKGGADETIATRFIPLIAPGNLNLVTANSTPATIGINVPTPASWMVMLAMIMCLIRPLTFLPQNKAKFLPVWYHVKDDAKDSLVGMRDSRGSRLYRG